MGFRRRRLVTIRRHRVAASRRSHRISPALCTKPSTTGSLPAMPQSRPAVFESLANPGGNLTGFYVFEPSLGAKLLDLLTPAAKTMQQSSRTVPVVFNQCPPQADQ